MIGGFQGLALLTAVVPAVPVRLSSVLVAGALGLLVLSFGRDVLGQERAERRGRRLDPRG